jgi:hypothetical protein
MGYDENYESYWDMTNHRLEVCNGLQWYKVVPPNMMECWFINIYLTSSLYCPAHSSTQTFFFVAMFTELAWINHIMNQLHCISWLKSQFCFLVESPFSYGKMPWFLITEGMFFPGFPLSFVGDRAGPRPGKCGELHFCSLVQTTYVAPLVTWPAWHGPSIISGWINYGLWYNVRPPRYKLV